MRHVPNILTVARILLTPLVLVLLMTGTLLGQAGALGLFILAAVSDYLDGKLARKMGARSRFGKFLDPLADKVLVLGTFVALAVMQPQAVPWWAVGLIAARDVVITTLRTWAEMRGESLQTLPLAKAKTTAQLTFLIGMLVLMTATHLPEPIQGSAVWVLDQSAIPVIVLTAVVVLTVLTGALYFSSHQLSSQPKRNVSRRKKEHHGV